MVALWAAQKIAPSADWTVVVMAARKTDPWAALMVDQVAGQMDIQYVL
jgi:hypothetical protein